MNNLRQPNIIKANMPEIEDIIGALPERLVIDILGLEINALLWGDQSKPPILLVHGTKDHARSWDWTIARLIKEYCLIAVDLRGHGDSGHVPGGGYDHHDMVADMAAVMAQLEEKRSLTGPFHLIGHSLGGNIVLHLAAAYPDKTRSVIAMEGLGVSQAMYDRFRAAAPGEHLRKWIDRKLAKHNRKERRFANPQEAVARLQAVHKNLKPEQARHLALHGIRQYRDGWGWKHDPLLGFHLPTMTKPEDYLYQFSGIKCPILLMRGEDSWASDPERDGRMTALNNVRLINYENAGHWLHHDAFDAFLADVQSFLHEDD